MIPFKKRTGIDPGSGLRNRRGMLVLAGLVMVVAMLGLSFLNPSGFASHLAFMANAEDTVHPGDLILIHGTDWKSKMVRCLDLGSSDYSHVGILLEDNATWQVVHASAEKGSVVSEPIDEFLAEDEVSGWAVFRLEESFDHDALENVLLPMVRSATPFDDDFSWDSDSALYCTELLVKAYARVGVTMIAGEIAEGDYVFPSDLILDPISYPVLRSN